MSMVSVFPEVAGPVRTVRDFLLSGCKCFRVLRFFCIDADY